MEYSGTILLCGNPNVGKSTLFNRLTGMHQHTGNWPGKTVGAASGEFVENKTVYQLVDLPGCYSLCSRSWEEEAARDKILFGTADLIVVVCDATCLARGLVLLLQVLEITGRVVLCVNLMDEARSRGVHIDTEILSEKLGIPVCGISAASGMGMEKLRSLMVEKPCSLRREISMPDAVVSSLEELSHYLTGQPLPHGWLARSLAEGDPGLCDSLMHRLCLNPHKDLELDKLIDTARENLRNQGYTPEQLGELAAETAFATAHEVAAAAVHREKPESHNLSRRLDSVLTHPVYGIPVMVLLLAVILWLTVRGANFPSEWLSRGLFSLGEKVRGALLAVGMPLAAVSAIVDGIWRTAAWVVSVMLPPMAIFFPLFTVLEDLGYLPRVAFHLDGVFARCGACGKQGLTMCMGLGCNAAGVTGCRIIDSPRERRMAVLTNAFVPCNGRFPVLIALSGLMAGGAYQSAKASLAVTGAVILGVACTFAASAFLGKTILKGAPSSFALELPPYRRPRLGDIFVRSVRDRTAYVLGRALLVAAPAGLMIWVLANVRQGVVLQLLRQWLDPVGAVLGLDGAILLAFVLALPANEIFIPLVLMVYTAGDVIQPYESLSQLTDVFFANGWTVETVLCVIVFTVLHWPCGTTILTVVRETGHWKWGALAAALPTAFGAIICAALHLIL